LLVPIFKTVVIYLFVVKETPYETLLANSQSSAGALRILLSSALLGGEHTSGTLGVIVTLLFQSNLSEIVVVCDLKTCSLPPFISGSIAR